MTRFSQIHNLTGQEITQLNGFYQNFCSHLEQESGFHSYYSCKHTLFGMQDKCNKVTQIHNLKEQVIPKLNGVYANCVSHLELQVNGFNLYS